VLENYRCIARVGHSASRCCCVAMNSDLFRQSCSILEHCSKKIRSSLSEQVCTRFVELRLWVSKRVNKMLNNNLFWVSCVDDQCCDNANQQEMNARMHLYVANFDSNARMCPRKGELTTPQVLSVKLCGDIETDILEKVWC
jgi:hypothetical protein